VSTGNAGAIDVLVEDRPTGNLGKAGAARHRLPLEAAIREGGHGSAPAGG
jgi:hypothetical protein